MRHPVKSFFAILGLIALATVPQGAQAEGKDLKLCYTNWGQHGGEDLPGKGFIPDLVSRIFNHAGYTVSVDIVPWPRCINLAKQQCYDLVASGWRGANFDPFFEYLNITLRNDISFIVPDDSPIQSGELKNFHGKTIAYVRDSGGMDAIRDNPDINTREVSKMVTMIPILNGKRDDAVITDPDSFFMAASEMDPPLDDQFRILQPPFSTNFNSPLIAKGHPQLEQIREDFDRAFQAMIKDGLYQDMIALHGGQFTFQVPLHARQ